MHMCEWVNEREIVLDKSMLCIYQKVLWEFLNVHISHSEYRYSNIVHRIVNREQFRRSQCPCYSGLSADHAANNFQRDYFFVRK